MESSAGAARDGSPAEVPHPRGVRDLKRERLDLATTQLGAGVPGPDVRRAVSVLTIERLAEHWADAVGDAGDRVALGAVGSVGRADAGPASDLDLILLHDGKALAKEEVADLASKLWYPIWDAGVELDYSARSLTECRQVASKDLAAAAGLLDLHAIAGDANFTQQVRSAIYQDWRNAARKRLPELLSASRARVERHGELAYLIEPHLKEARGGLRDFTSLAALAATWLTDRPHGAVDEAGAHLMNVRDAIHVIGRRPHDILGRHVADEVAELLGYGHADDLLASLAEAGRTVANAVEVTERGARRSLERSGIGSRAWKARKRGGAPRHIEVAKGLIDVDGDLALAPHYVPEEDALLPLRAAACAANTGLAFTPSLLVSLTKSPPLPEPWPHEAREHLRDLLRGGNHLISVWESIDLHGLVVGWIPEWEDIRNRPQRSPVHRFTVDRHMLEAVVLAGKLRRQVRDGDLLLMAAWLHDIGKRPGAIDHSEDGAVLIPDIAARMGLEPQFAADIELLVREHLTLAEYATKRDPEDPATASALLDAVGHRADMLETLRALTEADAKAAGPKAWTKWRAQLIDTLTENARATLAQEGST